LVCTKQVNFSCNLFEKLFEIKQVLLHRRNRKGLTKQLLRSHRSVKRLDSSSWRVTSAVTTARTFRKIL